MHDAAPALHETTCRNCGAPLTGPYCAHCGQHSHESARSLHVLFHDAWHLMTHLDGRLWSTLALLLFKPGTLTREYFADHRAGYVPPFRLYFVISVAFFGLAALTTTLSELHAGAPPTMTAADRAELQKDLHDADTPTIVTATADAFSATGMTPQVAAELCSHLGFGMAWLDPRMQSVCRRQVTDQGKSMMHELGSLVPKMMFVFLPLVALVMLGLYHAPRRFYVEHLVFLLHVQSTLFLAMMVKLLLLAATEAVPALAPVDSLVGVVLFFYAVWYVFAALHRYYGQGRGRTLMKFAALFVAYLVCFGLSLAVTVVVSAIVT